MEGNAVGQGVSAADLFAQLDKNKDGRLVTEEIPEGQYRFFERLLRLGDKNQDSAITLEEFTAVMEQPASPGTAAPASKSPAEMKSEPAGSAATSESGKDSPPGQSQQDAPAAHAGPGDVLRRLDLNGDGKLQRSELPASFAERLEPIFKKLETDAITVEQLLTMLPLIQQNRKEHETVRGRLPDVTIPEQGGQLSRDERMQGRVAGHEMRFLKMLDTDGNGKLSETEIAGVRALFSKLDSNGDGELDVAELIFLEPGQAMTTPAGVPSSGSAPVESTPAEEGEFVILFKRMDANGDGVISREESPERIRKLFELMDQDGDGHLSREELRAGLEQMKAQRTVPGQ